MSLGGPCPCTHQKRERRMYFCFGKIFSEQYFFLRWLQKHFPNEPIEKVNTKVNRLKWMLEQNLGSNQAFEFRKQELELLTKRKVSDEEVCQHFIDSIKPGGIVYEFLHRGTTIVNSIIWFVCFFLLVFFENN
jgi:hypothetical protein